MFHSHTNSVEENQDDNKPVEPLLFHSRPNEEPKTTKPSIKRN